jgi:hypothetical protein
MGDYFLRLFWLLDYAYEGINIFRNFGENHTYIPLLFLSARKKTGVLSESSFLQLQDNENMFAYSL